MSFKKGDKVILVKKTSWSGLRKLKIGEEYTVQYTRTGGWNFGDEIEEAFAVEEGGVWQPASCFQLVVEENNYQIY